MATAKKTSSSQPVKLTAAQMRKKIESLEAENEKLRNSAWCYLCDTVKDKGKFYVSTDPRAKSELTPICKECARKLALRVDKNGETHEPTKESVQLALRYLDKPFINSLWDSSIQESENLVAGKIKHNVWTSYIKNVAMVNYVGMTYQDSDMFKEKIIYEDEKTPDDLVKGRENQDTYTDFLKNKKDVVRLLSYDPFEKEAISDQPFLYSQLLGLLDSSEDANDDMMRTASAISIVRGFLQQSKIDDAVAKLMSDIKQLQHNSATIKSLQDSKSKITGIIKDLAAESCISLKNNKKASKASNTWTGKLKELKDLNIRNSEVNGFDIDTCKGMQQVADISMEAIIKKLDLQEDEYADMLAEQRIKLTQAIKKADAYAEAVRLLLSENVQLRNLAKSNNILNEEDLLDLDDVINTYIDGGIDNERS